MNRLDPETAALYAIIAICLVLAGAVLTAGPVSIEQRGAVLTGIFSALAFVAWRFRRRNKGEDE